MPPGKVIEEARSKLQLKLDDVKTKVGDIQEMISSLSHEPIIKAEQALLQKSKSKFKSLFPKAGQELEVCSNQLTLIYDAINSIINGETSDESDSDSENLQENSTVLEGKPQTSVSDSVVESSVVTGTEVETSNTVNERKRKYPEPQASTVASNGNHTECSKCGRFFASKISLKNHLKTRHTPYEEWPYVCSLCPEGQQKRYSLSNRLKEHVQFKHLGQASSVCEICGKGFGRPNHKEKHLVHCAAAYKKRMLESPSYQEENSEAIDAITTNMNTEADSASQVGNVENINIKEDNQACSVEVGILDSASGTVVIPSEDGAENIEFIGMPKELKSEEDDVAVMIITDEHVSTTNE